MVLSGRDDSAGCGPSASMAGHDSDRSGGHFCGASAHHYRGWPGACPHPCERLVLQCTTRKCPRAGGSLGERMRVLLIVSEAPPTVSGVARCADRLSQGLRLLGHDVDVLSSREIPRWTLGEFRVSSFLAHWPSLARRLGDYDLVNVHGPVPTMSDAFLWMAGRIQAYRRPALVYTHHCTIDLPALPRLCAAYERLQGRLAARSDRMIVSTPSYAGLFDQGPPVDVIPWGVDADDFSGPSRRPKRRGEPLRVLFLGQMRPYKGVPELLQASAGQDQLRVTLAGAGPLRERYRALAQELGMTNVTFPGKVPDAALPALYREHDVIVLPSTTRAEAFGLVLLEGMAAGCVPVASDLPGVRDVAGPTGLLVPPGDVDALRAALSALADDPAKLRRAGEASRARAAGMGWDLVARRYEGAMYAALATARARQADALPRLWTPPEHALSDLAARFGASWSSLLLFDAGRVPQPRASWGSVLLEQIRAQAPRIAQYVARTRRPLLLNAGAADLPIGRWLVREDVGSAMSVPIRTRPGTLGVLNLSIAATEGRSYGVRDLERLHETVSR